MRRTKTGPTHKHTTQWGFEIVFRATGVQRQPDNAGVFAQHAIHDDKPRAELAPFAAMLVTLFIAFECCAAN